MFQKTFNVYILTNEPRTVLYTGVTNDLQQRVIEHYQNRGQTQSFCGRYNVYWLLYFEEHKYINNAIAREKEIKGWSREKKMKLIAEMNPNLESLNREVFGKWPPEELPLRV
ncbi:MAG: endonuclease [Flavisolibacter sp.]|nr:endonuclease [Flavisolibacter sp.]